VISPARQTAFRVLDRVERGGYASDLLLAHAADLDTRDAGLASEIVFGCLRRQAQLDYLIDSQSGGRKLDREVRIALRMGAYQLRHLDRVPAHAAVSESVEIVRRARKASAAGLVNAVLRRIPRAAVEWPAREVELSMPAWLLAAWDAQFGAAVADRVAAAFLLPPDTWIRNPPPDRSDLVLEKGDVPGAWRVLSGSTQGLRIQDIGSQSIVPLLDLHAGMTFLDLCAAPGNKTAQALEAGVTGIACDVHLHRLRSVSGCARVALDATAPLPFRRTFDRILIDAPCSGTGTLGRNPEIRWRLRPEDIEELHQKQTAIVRRGLEHLARDGKLVYSTCSLERRENEDVVNGTGAQVLSMQRRTPGIEAGEGFFAAVIAG
jgi:16S rRNA (cytosine967-C5)-methyltransferase